MGFWGLGIVCRAPCSAPVLGGWLTDSYSWRWVFYIKRAHRYRLDRNDLAVYLLTPSYIRPRFAKKIDYWGIGLLAVGIATLQIVLDKGPGKKIGLGPAGSLPSPSWQAFLLVAFFLIYELHIKDPVVNLRVF